MMNKNWIIEWLAALLALLVIFRFSISWKGGVALLFVYIALLLLLLDSCYFLLPDNITLSLLWLGIFINLHKGFTDLESAVLGVFVGYLWLWGCYWLFFLLTGKAGLGFGDCKFFAALGAWFGWQVLPQLLLLACLLCIIHLVMVKAVKRRLKRVTEFPKYLPLGSYLATSSIIILFLPSHI